MLIITKPAITLVTVEIYPFATELIITSATKMVIKTKCFLKIVKYLRAIPLKGKPQAIKKSAVNQSL